MACWRSWNTFSWRSRSRVTSAINHTDLRPSAFARGLEQAVDRFRHSGIADEHPLDRPHIVTVGGPDQVEIGGIGVEHPPALVGDQDTVEGLSLIHISEP